MSQFSSVQFSSDTQSCPTLCDPMNCSTPGLPAHHQLPEFAQTHIHWVSDAIEPSHPLLSPLTCPQYLPESESFPMSQHFAWGGQSTRVSASASFLPKKSQGWSPYSPRDSQESSPTPQFKSINSLVLSFLYSPTLTSIHDHWKTIALTRQTFVGKVMSLLLNTLSRLVITFFQGVSVF